MIVLTKSGSHLSLGGSGFIVTAICRILFIFWTFLAKSLSQWQGGQVWTMRIVPCYFVGPRPCPHGKTNRFPIGALNSENGVVFYCMCVLPSQKLLSDTEKTGYLEKSTLESSQNVSRVGTVECSKIGRRGPPADFARNLRSGAGKHQRTSPDALWKVETSSFTFLMLWARFSDAFLLQI